MADELTNCERLDEERRMNDDLRRNGAHPSRQGPLGPRKPVLYLAGPINACSDSEAMDWREEVKQRLSDCYDFLDPMRHDYRGRELEPGVAEEIVGNDLQDIYSSDAILANCPKPSVGTSMEIYHCFEVLHKDVIVIAPHPMSPWLKRFSTVQYTNLGAGITYARTISKRLIGRLAREA